MKLKDLKDIEARAARATKGPWKPGVLYNDGVYPIGPYSRDEAKAKLDAEFIAHAREDVPALVKALREARSGRLESSVAAVARRIAEAKRLSAELANLLSEDVFQDAVDEYAPAFRDGESPRLGIAENIVRTQLARGDGAAEESVQEVLAELERLRKLLAAKSSVEAALGAAREAMARQQLELETLRSRADGLEASLARQTAATEVVQEENARLAKLLAMKDEGNPEPVEWPRFPENTLLRMLTTYSPSGFIDIAIVEGDSAAGLAKRMAAAVAVARKASAKITGVSR